MSHAAIVDHYDRADLLASIDHALVAAGIEPAQVTVEQLAPVDEFHIGGRPATIHLVEQLNLGSDDHVLDIGCGIGGAARLVSSRVAKVTGYDLTPAYVQAGTALNQRLGLDRSIELGTGEAMALPAADGSFDGGYLLHVGMNIEEKGRLLTEVARVLKPGARFGIYDVMRVGDGELSFPVPWSSEPDTSHVAAPADYSLAASEAGLVVVAEENRAEAAKAFFDRLAAAGSERPPPLGLHLLMGPTIGQKVANMVAGVRDNIIAPVELILQRGDD